MSAERLDTSQWSLAPASTWPTIAQLADEAGVDWMASSARQFARMDAGIHPLDGETGDTR